VWLALDLVLVLLGLVLIALSALRVWSRFRRMGREGTRFGHRVSELADQAAGLGDRVGALEADTRGGRRPADYLTRTI